MDTQSSGQNLAPLKKILSVQLCRIVCMLMVIFNHTLNQFYAKKGFDGIFAKYWNLLNICAVGTFFIITGFFLFQKKFAYAARLKKLLFELLLPSAAVLLAFIFLQAGIRCENAGFSFSLQLKEEFVSVGKQLLAWNFSGAYSYLWFVLAYTEIIVLYPVYFLLCNENRIAFLARRLLLALCFLCLLAANMVQLFRISVSVPDFTTVSSNGMFVLIGYELKRLYDGGKLKGLRVSALGLGLFLLGVLLGAAYLSVELYFYDEFTGYWFHLWSHAAVCSAVGLFLFFIALPLGDRDFPAVRSAAAAGVFVYLLQTPIHSVLKFWGINSFLYEKTGVFSYFLIGILCAMCSFFLAFLLKYVQNTAVCFVQKKKSQ